MVNAPALRYVPLLKHEFGSPFGTGAVRVSGLLRLCLMVCPTVVLGVCQPRSDGLLRGATKLPYVIVADKVKGRSILVNNAGGGQPGSNRSTRAATTDIVIYIISNRSYPYSQLSQCRLSTTENNI